MNIIDLVNKTQKCTSFMLIVAVVAKSTPALQIKFANGRFCFDHKIKLFNFFALNLRKRRFMGIYENMVRNDFDRLKK